MNKIYKQYLEAIMMNDANKVKTIMPVAAGLIIKEGENGEKLLLLIQRSSSDHFPDFYEFPRGKCDKPMGENLIHCLKREVKEETSLDVIPIKEIDTFEYLADGGTRKSICHNFLCRMKDPNQKVKLSHEHQDFKWIQSVGEAELLVLPDQKKSIQKAFNEEFQIVSYPENHFTKDNSVEEVKMLDIYLNLIQEDKSSINEVLGDITDPLTGVMMGIAVIAIAGKVSDLIITKKECKNYKPETIPWAICQNQVKNKNDKKKINVMKSKIHLCKKSKQPLKCKGKVMDKINKMQLKIKKREMKIKQLSKSGKK